MIESLRLHTPSVVALILNGQNTQLRGHWAYYITSLVMLAVARGPVVRSHWAIENSLHWVLDMVFRDDESRARTDHAPANFTTIKHMAANLLRRPTGTQSLRARRKAASWNDDFLASLLAA
jgi:predicted transposase YbfD/YdcC